MVNIEVCVGTACYLKGSYHIINRLDELTESNNIADKVNVSSIFCLNNCTNCVSVKFNDDLVSLSMDNIDEFFKTKVIPLAK